MRDRVFLIAYHRHLGVTVVFPEATHLMAVPAGYGSTRNVALKHVDLFEGGYFLQAREPDPNLPGPITCGEAIGDLPRITQHLSGKLQPGVRRFDKLLEYPGRARNGPGTMTYSPARIEVRKGEQVKFVLKNTGYLAHEFLLDSFENNAKHKIVMEKHPEMEHDDPNGKRVDSKKSAEILWRFTKVGTFEYACLIPGHYESGMKGIVVVK